MSEGADSWFSFFGPVDPMFSRGRKAEVKKEETERREKEKDRIKNDHIIPIVAEVEDIIQGFPNTRKDLLRGVTLRERVSIEEVERWSEYRSLQKLVEQNGGSITLKPSPSKKGGIDSYFITKATLVITW